MSRTLAEAKPDRAVVPIGQRAHPNGGVRCAHHHPTQTSTRLRDAGWIRQRRPRLAPGDTEFRHAQNAASFQRLLIKVPPPFSYLCERSGVRPHCVLRGLAAITMRPVESSEIDGRCLDEFSLFLMSATPHGAAMSPEGIGRLICEGA
jgi:hypothetical protein